MHSLATNPSPSSLLPTPVFSHPQHLYSFVALLAPRGGTQAAAKRQLDCAGVVVTVYAACMVLATSHHHTDLLGVRMQVG